MTLFYIISWLFHTVQQQTGHYDPFISIWTLQRAEKHTQFLIKHFYRCFYLKSSLWSQLYQNSPKSMLPCEKTWNLHQNYIKQPFFPDYVINVLPTYRKKAVMELGTAKGQSQPPHTEPLLNTNTIFIFIQELLRKMALHRAVCLCYTKSEES